MLLDGKVSSLVVTSLLLVDVVSSLVGVHQLNLHVYHYALNEETAHLPGRQTHHYLAGAPTEPLGPHGTVEGLLCHGRPVVVHHVHTLSTVFPCSAVAVLLAWLVVTLAAFSERARAMRAVAMAAPLLQPLVVGFPRAFDSCGQWCGYTQLVSWLPYAYLGGLFYFGGVVFLTVIALVVCPCCYRRKGPSPTAVALKNGLFALGWVYMFGLAAVGYAVGSPCRRAGVAYASAPLYAALAFMGLSRLIKGIGPCFSCDPYMYHRAISHQFRLPCAAPDELEEDEPVEEYDPRAAYLEMSDPSANILRPAAP